MRKIAFVTVKYLWAITVVLFVVHSSGINPFGGWPPMPAQDKFLCAAAMWILLFSVLNEWGKYDD